MGSAARCEDPKLAEEQKGPAGSPVANDKIEPASNIWLNRILVYISYGKVLSHTFSAGVDGYCFVYKFVI